MTTPISVRLVVVVACLMLVGVAGAQKLVGKAVGCPSIDGQSGRVERIPEACQQQPSPNGSRTALIVRLPETASAWPWLAIGGIAAMLAVISLAARRQLPFGNRF